MSKLKVTKPSDTTIRFERTLAASRERVFAAYTEADKMKVWFADPANPVTEVTSDPRQGGNYSISWSGEDGAMTMRGTYLKFQRPSYLHTDEHWEPNWPGGVVFNDVHFEEKDDVTTLTLTSTHVSKQARDGAFEGSAAGFGACLDAMEALLTAED